jgi:hypothetical protein
VFECLLRNCLRHGKTSVSENGVTFSLTGIQGATVLFFNVDNRPDCRRCVGLDQSTRACDVLVAIFRDEKTPVLAFVELKGKELEHGVKQINRTARAVKEKLGPSWKEYHAVGVLVRNKSAPGRKLKRDLVPVLSVRSGIPRSLNDFLKELGLR